MKVLFVDTSIEGHHQTYLRGLVENSCDDVCAYLPVEDAWLKEKGYMQVVHQIEWKEKSIIQFMKERWRVKEDIVCFCYCWQLLLEVYWFVSIIILQTGGLMCFVKC